MARTLADVKDTADADLDELIASWTRSMRAERKSPDTVRSYLAGVSSFADWCEKQSRPVVLDTASVETWTTWMLDLGRAPATAVARQRGVRRFSAWLETKKIIEQDRVHGLKPPKVDEAVVPALTDAQLRKLLATCSTSSFHDVRDHAILQLLCETGARAAEVVAMEVADVNLDAGVAVVRRGKGGKGRIVPVSPQCAELIEDYLRMRRKHPLAKRGSADLWLGTRNRSFGYYGLYGCVARRAEAAGLGRVHPHVLRHTSAVRWLNRGGSTTGLMAISGWSSVDMLRRYIRASEGQLATDEAKRLGLGDL